MAPYRAIDPVAHQSYVEHILGGGVLHLHRYELDSVPLPPGSTMTRSPGPQRRTSDNGDAVMGSSRRPAASYVHGLEGPTRYTAARPIVRLWRSQWALTKDATVAALLKVRATMAAALAGVADVPHALDKFAAAAIGIDPLCAFDSERSGWP